MIALIVATACGGGTSSGNNGGWSGGATAPTTVDCTAANALCPTINIAGDAPQASPSKFHGYADPSMRKDPNAAYIYMAYSWPHVNAADLTRVVDLHLAHSSDSGTTWNYDGALFTSEVITNATSPNYAAINDSSHETMDLLPISQNGSTLWVQAHMSYLAASGGSDIYSQLDKTGFISVSAVFVPAPGAANAPQAVLSLGNAPEAKLGTNTTDSTIGITQNIATLNPALTKCSNWGQAALYYDSGILYLTLQCTESVQPKDSTQLSHIVFSTTPLGSDATQWTWSYVGMFATMADAAKLGTAEGQPYQFFTEMALMKNATGQLIAIASPSILTATGQQPVIQYGCRVFKVTSLSSPALQTDATGTPAVTAKVTASDLYTGADEGPGACTYEPAANTGILIVRKLENDPVQGFFVTLQASKLKP